LILKIIKISISVLSTIRT